jgi:hypothetical protein
MAQKVTTTKHHLVFDIDSATIAGGLFRYGYDAHDTCIETIELYSLRKSITSGNEYPFERFFKQTLKTLAEVCHEVHLQSMIPLDGIYCNVGMPWMSAQKRTLEYRKETPFIFTRKLSNELIGKESDISLSKNIDYSNHDVELISRHTLDIYGNGYKLRKPIGKEMKEVTLHSLTSVMSTITKQSFVDVIEKVFHRTPDFVSNTYLRYQEIITTHPDVNNVVVIDMSGEVTEVLVIENDNLKHIGSLSVGLNTITRSLRDQLGIPLEKAKKIFHLHHDQKLDNDYGKSISGNIDQAFRTWFKPFFNLIDEYAKQGLLPHTLVLRTHKSYMGWFEYMFLKEDILHEHMHTEGSIEVLDSHHDELYSTYSDYELAGAAHFIGSKIKDDESKEG